MINSGHVRGPGSGGGSNSSRKSQDVVPNQFPAGLRVLVVDDDSTCLMILERMLRTCLYEVTKCNRAEIALSLLRKDRNGFDIVLSDVHMPDMDGFKLLEHIGLEMDLPVIMMSADDSRQVVMKGVTHGARDYLIKPVRIEALKNIWQHVVRKRRSEWNIPEQCGSFEEGSQHKPNEETDNNSSSLNEGTNNSWRSAKRRKEEEGEDQEDKDDSSTLKKPRVVWSVELHQQFVAAVNQLGVDKAVPKRILELMNVPGLTRENVASHLQKYRIYLRRIGGVAQHQGNLSNAFISPQEASLSHLSSLGGFDLQALAAAGLPAQSLAQLQVATISRPTAPRSGIPVLSLADQRNVFSFENPKVRFAEGQSMIGVGNANKQMNLLHGIPTAMEPKQLAGLQSVGVYGIENQIMVHGGQQMQPLGQILPSSFGQPHMPNSLSGRSHISNNVFGRKGVPSNVLGTKVVLDTVPGRKGVNDRGNQAYNAMSQQDSLVFNNFPLNQTGELPGNRFSRGNAPGIPITVSKGETYQEEVNSSETKRSSGFAPGYDMFNDLQHHSKTLDWDLQNAGLGILDAPSVFPVSEGYSSSSSLNKYGQKVEINQHMDSFFAGHGSTRVKSERALETGCLQQQFPDQYNQEDLMSALLRQEGIAAAENDFEFDGYSIDNVHVL